MEVLDEVCIRCFEPPVCRFHARIIHMVEEPPLLLLDYPSPESFDEIERRAEERKKLFIRTRFLEGPRFTERRSWEGYILDISHSGCLILGESTFLVGQSLFLSFSIPWSGEVIQSDAQVVRSEVTEKGIRSGVKFMALTADNQERLDQFIRSLNTEELSQMVSIIAESHDPNTIEP
jgi:c-di-GMP-binding flagellar brake protein YcgR